jgi:hypothetical protein
MVYVGAVSEYIGAHVRSPLAWDLAVKKTTIQLYAAWHMDLLVSNY